MIANLVCERANAPGLGDLTLLGGTLSRMEFRAQFADGALCYYVIVDDQYRMEAGWATLHSASSPATLTRTTVLWNSTGASTNGVPNKLNFTGAVLVTNQVPAERTVFLNPDKGLSIPAGLGAVGAITAASLNVAQGVNAATIQQGGNTLLPRGIITMWAGAANAIPAGWLICDGGNGTPDLRGRFIIGVGPGYGVYATGGDTTTSAAGSHSHGGASGTAGAHSHTGGTDSQGQHNHSGSTAGHTLTVEEMPAHSHSYDHGSTGGGGSNGTAGGSAGTVGTYNTTNSTGNGNGHAHDIFNDGAHTHALNIASAGDHAHSIAADGSHTHTIIPPYYALCYIMKA